MQKICFPTIDCQIDHVTRTPGYQEHELQSQDRTVYPCVANTERLDHCKDRTKLPALQTFDADE
jgi:hypothetical protein